MKSTYIRVAVPQPLRRLFDYTPPESLTEPVILPGMRVKVPWGKKEIIGVVVSIDNETSVPPEKLRPISAVLDQVPLIPDSLMAFYLWIADYYHHPVGETLALAFPRTLRKNLPKSKRKQKPATEQVKETTVKQDEYANFSPLTLNEEQARAVETIRGHFHHFTTIVLDGVTGSGKTEVYLHCIYDVISRGKQVLALIPEISLTPQTVERFQSRFPNTPLALFHSGLSDKERLKQWQSAQSGEARIIIGTRSVLLTPLPNLGLIIVDEAHDASFKQQDGLRYSARDLALKRGQLTQIPVILGSATHALDTLLQVKNKRFLSLSLTQRAGEAKLPAFEVIDVRRQKMHEGLAIPTQKEIERHLAEGNQVLLFLNRRGFASALLCHDCGWTAQCQRCDARMTLHRQPWQLQCHHCGAISYVPRVCQNCQGENILNIGAGTERIEQHLQQLFPTYQTVRIDRDTAYNKETLENLLEEIHDDAPKILIGTQMLAKGHHFPNVTLVGILNVDQGLCSPDFRASEQLAQLIVQVAGRAGRAQKKGMVLLQTHYPDNPLIVRLLQEGYCAFADEALAERAIADLPPYTAMAVIRAESTVLDTSMVFLESIKELIQARQIANIIPIGPMPALMTKRAGHFRAILIFQAANKSFLQQGLSALMREVEQVKVRHKVRWHIDVDPINMY